MNSKNKLKNQGIFKGFEIKYLISVMVFNMVMLSAELWGQRAKAEDSASFSNAHGRVAPHLHWQLNRNKYSHASSYTSNHSVYHSPQTPTTVRAAEPETPGHFPRSVTGVQAWSLRLWRREPGRKTGSLPSVFRERGRYFRSGQFPWGFTLCLWSGEMPGLPGMAAAYSLLEEIVDSMVNL